MLAFAMIRTTALLPVLALLLGACASAAKYGPADDTALEPMKKVHMTCLMNQTQALIHGSDDVNFLTRHIVSQCDPELKPMADYLRGRKFNDYTVSRFLDSQRQIGMEATANVILRVKASQNESPDSYR